MKRLMTTGPASVTVRGVCADVGTSSQAIYTCFGGRPGLVAAVRDALEDALDRELRAVPGVGRARAWRMAVEIVRYATRRPELWRWLHELHELEPLGPPRAFREALMVGWPDACANVVVDAWLLVLGCIGLAAGRPHDREADLLDRFERLWRRSLGG